MENNFIIKKLIQQKERKENNFLSLSVAKHNAKIKTITYSNNKVTKPLFFIGAVLPDFKISWGILLVYIVVKTPLKIASIKHGISDIRTLLNKLCLKWGLC